MKFLKVYLAVAAFAIAIGASSFTVSKEKPQAPAVQDYAWILFDCTDPNNPIIIGPGNFTYDNPPSLAVCPNTGSLICAAKFRLRVIGGQPVQAVVSGTTATLVGGTDPYEDNEDIVRCE